MKTFKIYQHPTDGYESVKKGFSWPAFFFGIIWMPLKKLWKFFGIWMLIIVVLAVIEVIAEEFSFQPETLSIASLASSIIMYALWWIPGFKGNSWREKNLKKRGYNFVKELQAKTAKDAEAVIAKDLTSA